MNAVGAIHLTRSVERKSTSTPATVDLDDEDDHSSKKRTSMDLSSSSDEGGSSADGLAVEHAQAMNNRAKMQEEQELEHYRQEWDTIEAQGLEFEQEKDFDQALSCFERVLLARSHYLGEYHVDVAKSLVNTGRVMELSGNTEGSLDLYRVAHAIYSGKVTSNEFRVAQEDAFTILELVPSWMEQGRYEEAVAFLTKCLEAEHNAKNSGKIHLELGRAYLGLRQYTAATVCLVEAAKNDVQEEEIFGLLQQVEFLQREAAEARSLGSSNSDTTRDVESASEEEESASSSGSVSDSLLDAEDPKPQIEKRPKLNITAPTERIGSDLDLSSSSSCSESNLFSEDDEDSFVSSPSVSGAQVPVSNEEPLAAPQSAASEATPKIMVPVTTTMRGLQVSIPELDEDSIPEPPDASPLRTPESKKSGGSRGGRVLRVPSPRKKGSSPRRTLSPSIRKKNFGSDRSKIARTLSDQFRRSPRRAGFASLPEEKEDVPDESAPVLPATLRIEEEYHASPDGPIEYINTRSRSWESSISQITFIVDDPKMTRSSREGWWWGVTAEGFGRWFPTNIVSPAVEAAEGFLSAKAIHSKALRPVHMDFVSEDESSDDEEETQADEDIEYPLNIGNDAVPRKDDESIAKPKEAMSSPRCNVPAPPTSSPLTQRTGKEVASDIVDNSALLIRQRDELGDSHPSVATTLFMLAVLQSRDESPDLAIESANEALCIQKASGNVDDAIRSLHFLADLHLHQKEYKGSLHYYAECLLVQRAVYGCNSEEAARTLNYIGTVHSLENEFGLAMQSHKEALQILKECHGENLKHPLVSETLCQIGAVYYRERNSPSTIETKTDDYDTFIETGMLDVIGRAHEDRGSYKMAISFFEEKLQFLRNRDGVDDIETPEEVATTLNSLGMLSRRAGLYSEAIDYYDSALNIQKELGCDDVYVATSQVLTATVEFHMGNWKKALQMLLNSHAILEEELGEEHQTVAATLYQIGVVQSALCDVDEAIGALEEAKSIQTRLLGADHPATLRTRRQINDMFAVYEAEVDTALEELNEILVTQRRIHGEKHPNVAETLHSIGAAQSRKGDYSQALRTLEECYYMRVEFLGWDHPLQGSTLHEIANIHLKGGRAKKSLHICKVILGIRMESLGEAHVDVARTLATKGTCLVLQGKFVEAKRYQQEALRRTKAAVGDDHPAVADVQIEMGALQIRLCEFEEARVEIKKALELYRSAGLEEDHPGIRDAVGKLERVDRDEMLYV